MTLVELIEDTARIRELPPAQIPGLLVHLASVQSALTARFVAANAPAPEAAPADHPERLLSLPDVAELLHISKSSAYELARRGEIKTIRVGKKYVRMRRADLDAYVSVRAQNVA